METSWLVGIDEAGRGPLAGPVSVGVVCTASDFDWASIPGVDDSKKITALKREEIYARAHALKKSRQLFFAVCMESAATIDAMGIVPAVQKAMERALTQIEAEIKFNVATCAVKLDGSLKAPKRYLNQETVIGGDGKEKIIGLASIVAKVTRDRHMKKLGSRSQYEHYGFSAHKGYGTENHRKLIQMYGLSDLHRKSYCRKIDVQV